MGRTELGVSSYSEKQHRNQIQTTANTEGCNFQGMKDEMENRKIRKKEIFGPKRKKKATFGTPSGSMYGDDDN